MRSTSCSASVRFGGRCTGVLQFDISFRPSASKPRILVSRNFSRHIWLRDIFWMALEAVFGAGHSCPGQDRLDLSSPAISAGRSLDR
jgi:hypothetical protein